MTGPWPGGGGNPGSVQIAGQPVEVNIHTQPVEVTGTVATVQSVDTPLYDAFSRQRVSLPALRLSAIFDTSDRTLYWTEKDEGGAAAASFNSTTGVIEMTLGQTANHKITRQTKEYFSYRAGQSQLIIATFAMETRKTGLRQRIGYFDASNGIFLEAAGTAEPAFVIRTSTGGAPSDAAKVAQSDWNIDSLDGNGPSGINLDWTARQILVIDFQWLGVGRVRVGFDIDGLVYWAHHFRHANETGQKLPYMRTPKLPVRYEIENTEATASNSTLRQICAAVMREGGESEPVVHRSCTTAITATAPTATTTMRTVLGVRLRDENVRATIKAELAELINLHNAPVCALLIINPVAGGTSGTATWADLPGGGSITEYSRSQVNVTVNASNIPNATGAVVLGAWFLPAGNAAKGSTDGHKVEETLTISADIDGVRDELWLCVMSTTGTGDVRGSLSWDEVR